LDVLSDIEVCEQDVMDIISTLNVEKAVGHDIITISERTSKHLQSKSGKTLFSSFKLDIEQKYLFKISAFSMDSYDNLKSFCGSERGGVSFFEKRDTNT
jgi:hypothetical protein